MAIRTGRTEPRNSGRAWHRDPAARADVGGGNSSAGAVDGIDCVFVLESHFAHWNGEIVQVARAAGVDGALVTDLPVEEAGAYLGAMREHDLSPVFLAASTSPDERLRRTAQASRGFVYAGSRTGVIGQRQQLADYARKLVKRLRRVTKLPIALGFGISTPEQFAEVGEFADAVAVGSAIVETIERNRGREAAEVGNFVGTLTAGVWNCRVRDVREW
jgi:tryptophan synthase alpha subunit